MNTSSLFPEFGNLNVETPSSSETVIPYPVAGFVKVTLWFVLNGWLGKKILWVGVDTTFIRSPKVDVAVDPNPTTVPTPMDSCGLKYIKSFTLESNKSVSSGILK